MTVGTGIYTPTNRGSIGPRTGGYEIGIPGMNWHVIGDWGSTCLRLFRKEAGVVVDRRDGPGIGALEQTPEDALMQRLGQWSADGRPDHVLLCGMAGARNGLREAPYVACPATLDDWRAGTLSFELEGVPIRIAAGVRMGGDDVMRGEETQIFGAISREPGLARGQQLLILPGTHSKWVWLEDGAIARFRTFFTGELFALLAKQSSLLNTRSDAGSDGEWEAGWKAGLLRAQEAGGFIGGVFECRAAQLLRGCSAAWGEGFLSAFLIGSEIEEGRQRGEFPGTVTLIGAPALMDRYADAFADYEVAVRREDGEQCVLSGLGLIDAVAG